MFDYFGGREKERESNFRVMCLLFWSAIFLLFLEVRLLYMGKLRRVDIVCVFLYGV